MFPGREIEYSLYRFEPFLIVVFALRMKRWMSKSYSHCWKGSKYAKGAGKLKKFKELEDFSEEHWAV